MVAVFPSGKSGRARLRNAATFSGPLQHKLESNRVSFARNLGQQTGELFDLRPHFLEVALFREQPREAE